MSWSFKCKQMPMTFKKLIALIVWKITNIFSPIVSIVQFVGVTNIPVCVRAASYHSEGIHWTALYRLEEESGENIEIIYFHCISPKANSVYKLSYHFFRLRLITPKSKVKISIIKYSIYRNNKRNLVSEFAILAQKLFRITSKDLFSSS